MPYIPLIFIIGIFSNGLEVEVVETGDWRRGVVVLLFNSYLSGLGIKSHGTHLRIFPYPPRVNPLHLTLRKKNYQMVLLCKFPSHYIY